MSKINKLFNSNLQVVNMGLESFSKDLKNQNVPVIHMNWRPPAGGNEKMMELLRKLKRL